MSKKIVKLSKFAPKNLVASLSAKPSGKKPQPRNWAWKPGKPSPVIINPV